MSPKALEVIPTAKLTNDSGVVVRFSHKNQHYYAQLTYNKDYVQFCQGSPDGDESPIETDIREIKEELAIDAEFNELIVVGSYSFVDYNALIEYNRESTTTVFFLDLPFERVEHLFPQGLTNTTLTIVDATSLQVSLNEINYVVAISEADLDALPQYISEIIIQKRVNGKMEPHPCRLIGHHSEFIRQLAGFTPQYDVSYLHTFNVNKL